MKSLLDWLGQNVTGSDSNASHAWNLVGSSSGWGAQPDEDLTKNTRGALHMGALTVRDVGIVSMKFQIAESQIHFDQYCNGALGADDELLKKTSKHSSAI
jgi:hypothetical protein